MSAVLHQIIGVDAADRAVFGLARISGSETLADFFDGVFSLVEERHAFAALFGRQIHSGFILTGHIIDYLSEFGFRMGLFENIGDALFEGVRNGEVEGVAQSRRCAISHLPLEFVDENCSERGVKLLGLLPGELQKLCADDEKSGAAEGVNDISGARGTAQKVVRFDDYQGPVINPGHVLESMWFCMAEGKKRSDQSVIDRSVQICEWALKRGYDPEYGGIYDIVTLPGYDLAKSAYYRNNYLRFDPKFIPEDKSWWVHSEALYALLLGATLTGKDELLTRFRDLHDWTFDRFVDPEYGEWYSSLHRDGTPKNTNKGAPYRGAFHVPRALMLIMLLLED